MRLFLLLTAVLSGLLPARAWAQADTILRLDGEEVRGRVVTLDPVRLRYVPALPAAPDTLALPVAEVFLVRYANGTRELLHPAAPGPAGAPDVLPGLTAGQRVAAGTADAARYYVPHGTLMGLTAITLANPILGLIGAAGVANKPLRPDRWRAPTPALLADPNYAAGYGRQAHDMKRRKAWGGFALGLGALLSLVALAGTGN